MTAFSCNGRITGYLISLDYDSSENGNPTIQVFRPTSSTSYSEVHEYLLQEDDITEMGTYHLANVSFTGDDRVEVQSGDIIGYHIRHAPRYNVWNIETMGYTSYVSGFTFIPINSFTVSGSETENNQPLIQPLFGNNHFSIQSIPKQPSYETGMHPSKNSLEMWFQRWAANDFIYKLIDSTILTIISMVPL